MRNERGLSLIEILIALTIMAVFSIGVVTITNQSVTIKEENTTEDKEVIRVERALSRIMEDFSQIYTPLMYSNEHKRASENSYPGFELDNARLESSKNNSMYQRSNFFLGPTFRGQPIPKVYNPSKQVLQFFTSANRRRIAGQRQSNFAWVRYEIRDTESEDEKKENLLSLVRYLINENIYNPEEALEKTRPYILMDNIISMKFQFWDPRSKRYVDSIREVSGGDLLMKSLKIVLKWKNYAGVEIETERVYSKFWPTFTPENMLELKKKLAAKKKTTGTSSGTSTSTNTTSGSGSGSVPATSEGTN